MPVSHYFAAAFPEDTLVFGACRPGYPDTAVTNEAVSEWIEFMKQRSIQRVICLLDRAQRAYYDDLLSQYRGTFGTANVFNFPITDYTKPSEHQLCEILSVLRGAIEGGIKTVVHCSAGVGRTGAVLAAYLVQIHRGHLPHWRQDGVSYFITTRLADSMPAEKLREWQQRRDTWLSARGLKTSAELRTLAENEQHEFHAQFTAQWHKWLDAGYGECQLRRPDVREILMKRLHAEPSLDAWGIMPNHVHALVAPEDKSFGEVMQSWKGGSAFEINRLLGRSGALWQKEPYDHIVRSEAQWQHYRRYIADNPIKAGLGANEYSVGIGGRAFKVASALAEYLRTQCG